MFCFSIYIYTITYHTGLDGASKIKQILPKYDVGFDACVIVGQQQPSLCIYWVLFLAYTPSSLLQQELYIYQ